MDIVKSDIYDIWFRNLRDRQARAKIAVRIRRLISGNFGDVKPIGGGLSELRIHFGAGYRIYFQQKGDVLILLLCGGDKSAQSRDIEKAKKIAKEWKDGGKW